MNAQDFEASFWGKCLNTFDEESKQYTYARYMKIPVKGFSFYTGGKSIIDIGGGPVSMLLKSDAIDSTVLDPLLGTFPKWVTRRYICADITTLAIRGEDLSDYGLHYDEAWIYNVLQHVADPMKVVVNARKTADVVRIFEWVRIPVYNGHPNELFPEDLDAWFEGRGLVSHVDAMGAVGTAYSGVFTK